MHDEVCWELAAAIVVAPAAGLNAHKRRQRKGNCDAGKKIGIVHLDRCSQILQAVANRSCPIRPRYFFLRGLRGSN